jgi:hypothetical protein
LARLEDLERIEDAWTRVFAGQHNTRRAGSNPVDNDFHGVVIPYYLSVWYACSASLAPPYDALGITRKACNMIAQHVKLHGKVVHYATWYDSAPCA